MRYRKYYTVAEWKKFDQWAERINGIDITSQEIMCKKYDIILTDYQTADEIKIEKKRLSREKKIKVIKRIGHIGGVIALQSYQALKAYNSKPVKKTRKKKRRKKQSTLYGLTGKS